MKKISISKYGVMCLAATSSFWGTNLSAEVVDFLPYIGPRQNKTCAYKPVKSSADPTKNIEVVFDANCTTAFVKPRTLNFKMSGPITFYDNSCQSYHKYRELKQKAINSKIELEEKLFANGSLSAEDEQKFEQDIEYVEYFTEQTDQREQSLIQSRGASFSLDVTHDNWTEDVQRFAEANWNYKNSTLKQPVVHGQLQLVTLEERDTEDDIADILRGVDNLDPKVLGKMKMVARQINSNYFDYLKTLYSVVLDVDQDTYMFGESTNVLGDLTGYGACMLDKDGDGRFTKKDLELGGAKGGLGNQLSFAYTFYTPFRTGTIFNVKIRNVAALTSAIQGFARSNPKYIDHGKFYDLIRGLKTTVVDYEVFSGASGVQISNSEQIQMKELARAELAEALISRVANLSATRAVRSKKIVDQHYRVKVCKSRIRIPFGGSICVRRGWESRTRKVSVMDYNKIIRDVIHIINSKGEMSKTIMLRNSTLNSIGSKFTEIPTED